MIQDEYSTVRMGYFVAKEKTIRNKVLANAQKSSMNVNIAIISQIRLYLAIFIPVTMMRFILPFLFVLSSSGAFAQKLDSLLDIQRKADPQEKIYVQFDKNYYNAGETIWFKAYLFTGNDPSEVSKNFYADLIDE